MGIQPFEDHADQYEDWFEKNDWIYQSELRAVKELLPDQGNGLEVGVGSGRFAGPLGIHWGVEPSSKMRKLANARGIEAVDAKGEDLPFSDSRFDFVLMVMTICFLDDIEKAFKEIHRILRPAGHLIIGFIDKNSPVGIMYQKHKNKSVFYKTAAFYSTDEIMRFLQKAGFGGFVFNQTICRDLNDIRTMEPVKSGHGEGSFVVIKALKE